MGNWGAYWSGDPVQNIYGRKQGGFDASRYFGTPNEFDKLFWQSKEGMPFAFQQFAGNEAAPDSYYNRWLQNREGELTAGFVDASRSNNTLAWHDYLASQAQGLAQRYTQLPGWQQGQNAPSTWAGRRL